MIDPKDSLQDVFQRYPSLRDSYVQVGSSLTENMNTEEFCMVNKLDFFSFWSDVCREICAIEKRESESEAMAKEQERQRKEKKNARRLVG